MHAPPHPPTQSPQAAFRKGTFTGVSALPRLTLRRVRSVARYNHTDPAEAAAAGGSSGSNAAGGSHRRGGGGAGFGSTAAAAAAAAARAAASSVTDDELGPAAQCILSAGECILWAG